MAQKFATSFYIIWKTPRYLRVLPLSTFRLCETFFSKKKFPKGPPSTFWSFPTERMLKNPKGSPLSVFLALWDFFLKKIGGALLVKNFFPPKVPLLQFFKWFATEWMKNLKVSPLMRQFVSTFGFFRYRRREYFDTLKSFCCFWPLDMTPTWAVPGLFKSKEGFSALYFLALWNFEFFPFRFLWCFKF